jgi:hypothetical protein
MVATSTDPPSVGTPPTADTAAEPDPAPAGRERLIGVGEWISAGSALVLLVLLFAAKWYGVASVPDPSAARPAVSGTESGWEGLSIVRWVLLLTIVVAIGSVFLHVSQRDHGARTDTSGAVAALGLLASVLLIYRVLIALPSADKVIDQKLGAFLAVLCALGIALGGHQSVTERRARLRTGTAPSRRRRRAGTAAGEPAPDGEAEGPPTPAAAASGAEDR